MSSHPYLDLQCRGCKRTFNRPRDLHRHIDPSTGLCRKKHTRNSRGPIRSIRSEPMICLDDKRNTRRRRMTPEQHQSTVETAPLAVRQRPPQRAVEVAPETVGQGVAVDDQSSIANEPGQAAVEPAKSSSQALQGVADALRALSIQEFTLPAATLMASSVGAPSCGRYDERGTHPLGSRAI
ncbi:hypothetical protein FA95DRAFT_1595446 [Auriscalpium vulgare]|uniref:Uncharacterized protein n=1 Tax=Auriscalpium vulgare TaxID=40419 RepID=A0ACB8RVG8_9AGAM|nr:hypothetical protein FA95DRAFT_1595446 [Auriscalpium vulgare]